MNQNEFDSFGVTFVLEKFGGFRDLKMEEQAFQSVPMRILHVNEVLDNIESCWVTKFISLINY